MRYRKVESRIWNDDKFRKLSARARYFFLYLLTSPHSTAWGAYVLDDLYIQADLQFTLEQIKQCWAEVIKEGLVIRDERTRLICLPNWFKYNPPTNQKTANACVNGILSMPRCNALSEFCRASDWVVRQLANCNLTAPEPLPEQFDTEHDRDRDRDIIAPVEARGPASGKATPGRESWITPYAEDWFNAYGGEMVCGKAAKPLRKLEQQHGPPVVLTHWRNYLNHTQAQFASVARFASTFGQWGSGSGGDDLDKPGLHWCVQCSVPHNSKREVLECPGPSDETENAA